MPRTIQSDTTEIIQPVLPRDAAGQPIGPIAWNDPDLSVQWRSSASGSWQSITLAPGTVGVWSPGGWVHIGDGVHLLGIPAAAIVPGDSTLVRVAYDPHPPQFDAIDAVVPPPLDPADLADTLGSVAMSVQPALTGDASAPWTIIQGDHYTDRPLRIDIDSGDDLTGQHLVIAARLQNQPQNQMALRMPIQTDGDGQYALFAPSAEQTELWEPGTYELRYRLQIAANHFRTIRSGLLNVLPFDTPEYVINVSP